jgi:hypothetical protein
MRKVCLSIVSILVASACGAELEVTAASSEEQQALMMHSVGVADSTGFCGAEFASCVVSSDGGVGSNGAGGGGGGGGSSFNLECDSRGECWERGTGCHPDSPAFQDRDIFLNAQFMLIDVMRCIGDNQGTS